MAMCNVNSEVTDSFYRYKMPRIIAKVEGKGNGIKTVIVNMVDIAKALSRPPAYSCKYFGCELGAQTQIDQKNEKYIVNGSHEAQKLQELLDGFIKKFVLCPECDNPETILAPNQRKKIIAQNCIACGYHNPTVDMTHKVTTYIINHPPEVSESAAKNYAQKKSERCEGRGDGEDSPPEADLDDAAELAASIATNGSHHVNDDDWSEDTTEAAVAQRQMDLSSAVKGLALTVELEKTPEERKEIFFCFVVEMKKTGLLDKPTSSREIFDKAVELEITEVAPLILVGIVFTQNVVAEIPEQKLNFLRFLHVRESKGGSKPNERAQKQLMAGLEKLIENHKNLLLPKVPKILLAAYENDMLSEEILVEWGKKKPTKKLISKELSKEIKEKAAPFLQWLAEAEDEEEEEEDEDDEDIVDFSTKTVITPVAPSASALKNGGGDDDDDDDADIDDI
jgi:translation initiation factor 5